MLFEWSRVLNKGNSLAFQLMVGFKLFHLHISHIEIQLNFAFSHSNNTRKMDCEL